MGYQFEAICGACAHRFTVRDGGGEMFELLHCETCGRSRSVEYAKAGDARRAELQGAAARQAHRQALKEHASRCRCGGHFRVGAPARCPKCRSTDDREDPAGHSILYDWWRWPRRSGRGSRGPQFARRGRIGVIVIYPP